MNRIQGKGITIILHPAGEKEAAQKKQAKAEKKQQKEAHLGIKKSSKKFRKGGLRIKKGVTIKVKTSFRLKLLLCSLMVSTFLNAA